MERKKYSVGVIVGRFAPIHKGHENLINIALKKCQKLVVVISDTKKTDDKTPYSLEYRKKLIEKIYFKQVKNNQIIFTSLEDDGKLSTKYGDKIIELVKVVAGNEPDYIIYGNDKDITRCFTKEAIDKMYCEQVNRDIIDVSSTKVRKALKSKQGCKLKKYLNDALQDEVCNLEKI